MVLLGSDEIDRGGEPGGQRPAKREVREITPFRPLS
jgi:hypothetical protein